MNEQEINLFLKELENAYKTIMRKVDLDNSDLVKNTKFTYKEGQLTISMYDYGKFVDSGRRRNAKGIPISDLIQWIQEKNIVTRVPIESLAYAIQRSIIRKGIKPRPFLEQVQEEVHKLTALFIQKQVEEELMKAININK